MTHSQKNRKCKTKNFLGGVNEEGSAGWGLSYLWRGRTKSEKQNGTNQVNLVYLLNIEFILVLQWGSEYQTSLVVKWLRVVRLSNGLLFKLSYSRQ